VFLRQAEQAAVELVRLDQQMEPQAADTTIIFLERIIGFGFQKQQAQHQQRATATIPDQHRVAVAV
jgi:hypothetical protein